MKWSSGLCALSLSVLPVLGVVPEWGQCGGLNYGGDTVCASGLTCVKQNDFYFQCLNTGASTTAVTTSATTTGAATTTSAAPPVGTGFVKVSGQQFTLNGAKFTVVGGNSYWVGLSGLNSTYMNQAFADIAKAGGTVVRTWGFNEVTSPSGVYYQSWSGGKPTINTGSTGLQNFDLVVAAAKANGIRLIVALTNNWGDYGGMDVYVNQIVGSGQAHSNFYTNAAVITAFKNYVNVFVSRYKNEPTIFGWELGNEPRCNGCNVSLITTWAKNISAYIKSIDTNHLVALGDEGFYNQPSGPNYPYQGGEGIDFEANLAITTLDFATVHAYPIPWGQTANPQAWGQQWIADHAASQKKFNKPVILEEFGVDNNQATVYAAWYSSIQSSGLTGDLIWQAGSHFPNGASSHDDGYTIYPDDPVYALQTSHAAAMKSRA